jgi:hypothetical protein
MAMDVERDKGTTRRIGIVLSKACRCQIKRKEGDKVEKCLIRKK